MFKTLKYIIVRFQLFLPRLKYFTFHNGKHKTYNDLVYIFMLLGMAVFTDITENYYNLYVSADRHTPVSAVIFATPTDPTSTVFLQRSAVTYR